MNKGTAEACQNRAKCQGRWPDLNNCKNGAEKVNGTIRDSINGLVSASAHWVPRTKGQDKQAKNRRLTGKVSEDQEGHKRLTGRS